MISYGVGKIGGKGHPHFLMLKIQTGMCFLKGNLAICIKGFKNILYSDPENPPLRILTINNETGTQICVNMYLEALKNIINLKVYQLVK